MTREDAQDCVVYLAAFYPQDIPDSTLRAYASQMVQFDSVSDAKAGIDRLVNTETDKFFPAWATVRKYVVQQTAQFDFDPEKAWVKVLRATQYVGHYRSPQWDDPFIALTIKRMGGWTIVCTEERDTHWLHKEFVATYKEMAERSIASGVVPGVIGTPGRHEIDNAGQRGDEGGLTQIEPKVIE